MLPKTIKCSCGCGKEVSVKEVEHHIVTEKMAGYESVLKFLDLASRKLSEKAKQKTSLEDKEAYYKEVKILDNARRRLRSLYYVYEDYVKTGEYEAPEIKKNAFYY